MEKIGHVRIDDRLIHGQIVASWINVLGCTTIVIADDKAVSDQLQTMMLQMACPPNIQLKIMKVADAAAYLEAPATERAKILVIVRDVVNALTLSSYNVGITEINVGNVSSAPHKKKFSKSVWLSEEDITNFRELAEKGIHLEVRVVPNEKATNLLSMIG
jgi:mannose/fructose/N-acetylgalactosamine-specific phosphotransferase system component IIB